MWDESCADNGSWIEPAKEGPLDREQVLLCLIHAGMGLEELGEKLVREGHQLRTRSIVELREFCVVKEKE